MEAEPPRVLVGNVAPILRLGLVAVLTEAGIDVIGQEHNAHRIVSEAGRLLPDAVVLDRDEELSRTLCARVREASPTTTVILWARDESLMEVLDPGSGTARVINPTVLEDLRSELAASRSEHLVEE
jgi:AmiR/NasT family two-component response regulator